MIRQVGKSRLFQRFTVFLLIFTLTGQALSSLAVFNPPAAGSAQAERPADGLGVERTDADGIVFELTLPDPEFGTGEQDGQACQTVSIPGWENAAIPGFAVLPENGRLVGLPQSGAPSLEILAADTVLLEGVYNLCRTPAPVIERQAGVPGKAVDYSFEADPAYSENQFYPAATVKLGEPAMLRSQRVAQVSFSPLQYNPVSGELRYTPSLQVEVHFNRAAGRAASAGEQVVDEGLYESSLADLLVNYTQALAWRSRPNQGVGLAPDSLNAPQSSASYKIPVKADGIYLLTYSALQSAGVPVSSLDPRTFQVFNQGSEVSILVAGENDGIFNTTDSILFYGQKVNTKYTDTNIYWLTWGSATGRRMAQSSGVPSNTGAIPASFLTTQHVESDVEYYNGESNGAAKDHWYWGMVYAFSGPVSMEFPTNLAHLAAGSHTITVRGQLKGYASSSTHHIRLYLNNNATPILDQTFARGSVLNFSVNVSQSLLVEGVNTLKVEAPRDGGRTYDGVLFNWWEVDYYDSYFAENDRLFFDGEGSGLKEIDIDGFSSTALEVFDLTNPTAPIQITGATATPTANGQRLDFDVSLSGERRFLAQTTARRTTVSYQDIVLDTPSSLKSSANGADYLLITHADFVSQAQTLANYRAGQGLRVQVINVQDVYDEFNGGVFNPEAIKSFLAYAYASWTAPAPTYVLLMGDGHFDYKDLTTTGEKTYIPPYLDDVDPYIGETATDNRFVSVSGSDMLPDMRIGRFAVRTAAEAQTVVDKTINYEQNPPSGAWTGKQLFIADNADSGGQFHTLSDQIVNGYVPAAYTVDKVYYGVDYPDANAARSAIKAAINQGRLIVHYEGHGSMQAWAGENLLMTSDIATLANGSMLPFVLPMTCAEGYFIQPSATGSDYSSIGESIVRVNGRGAVGSWSPTGYGLSSGHQLLDEYFYQHLYNEARTQVGDLTTQAKYDLFARNTSYNDLIETYLLFGDPALRLNILPIPLQAPANLTAAVASATQINLAWQDNSTTESGFKIERSPDGSTNWQPIAQVGANVTGFSNTGLTQDTLYYYRVKAYRNGDGASTAYTNTANARTYANRTLSLVPGWNLIALPLTPVTPYQAESLLIAINSQGNGCTEIDSWVSGGWVAHYAGDPDFDNFDIQLGQGYFVKCSQSSIWSITGSRLSSGRTLSLSPGWNLKGLPYPESGLSAHSVLTGIQSQGGSCSEIVDWVAGGWVTHYLSDPDWDNFTILPAKGYFLRCSTSSSYTP